MIRVRVTLGLDVKNKRCVYKMNLLPLLRPADV